jgi:hypothetical protein
MVVSVSFQDGKRAYGTANSEVRALGFGRARAIGCAVCGVRCAVCRMWVKV